MSGHGGNLRQIAEQAGRPADQVVDFSANINPLGPPECVRRVISRAVDSLVHYPDSDCVALVEAVASRYDLPAERIVVGNGSTEVLHALMRTLGARRAVIPVPTYIDYAEAARLAGLEIRTVPLAEDAGFEVDFQTLSAELADGDAVFLGQPNNPTGLLVDRGQLIQLIRSRPAVTFVIDEAFADFVPDYRPLLASAEPNLVVLRSLTKFYAIPGLRLGFASAQPALARRIRGQIPPWSVNTLAQAVGVAMLADTAYAARTVAHVAEQRQALQQRLGELPGLCVYPGRANFLLARLNRSDVDAAGLAERLLADGIAIRTFSPDQHLDGRFFRVAVRSAEENERLVAGLGRALSGSVAPRTRKRPTAAIMLQGTSSSAGKSVLTAALCRILLQDGHRVAPFKSQNMSLNSFVTRDGGEMGRAQVVQAQACRLEPDVRMNPVLLKPSSDTGCQVIIRGKPVGHMRVGQYVDFKPQAWQAARQCYDELASQFDAIVIEGAGSPGEVNLKGHDIANMRVAQYASAPVVIVGDIDRGGVFASFVGTMEVLSAWERSLVAGWIVNRFRGDPGLLGPALDYTLAHTGRPVFGVVPYLSHLNIPQEDSVEFKGARVDGPADRPADGVDIVVIDLPHISNFTDFDALRLEPDVRLRIVRSADQLGQPDAVILPGSKSVISDLDCLRRTGLADAIVRLAGQRNVQFVGVCGGLQMLGRRILDPDGIESAVRQADGLGLLEVTTVLAPEKVLRRVEARHVGSGLPVIGYEIHHGRTDGNGLKAVFSPAGGGGGNESPAGAMAGDLGVTRGDGRVWGTYLHGLFDADAFRRWFIDRLRVARGLAPLGRVCARYDIEPALDRLAEAVRASLDIERIYRVMGLA